MSEKEKNWSVIGTEEDGSLRRTMECLRGRLVAERQCSRAAKESADELSIKLKELEKKLKEETKMRDRAENKLRHLQRKMESIRVAVRSKDSEQQPSSSVSENSLVSCESSVTTIVTPSATKHPQEQEANSCIRKGLMSVNLEDNNAPENAELKQTDDSSNSGDDRKSIVTEISSEACHEKIGPDLEVFKPYDDSSSSRELSEEETDSGVDNSLAIVAVNSVVPEESQTRELKIINRSVSEVLEVLRLAREGIQRRMKQKQEHLIKLGPAQAQAC